VPGTSSVAIIGAGNVSLDVARILLSSPRDLAGTDIPQDVLDLLGSLQIRDIHIIARGRLADAKFSPKEVAELDQIPNLQVLVHENADQPAQSGPASQSEDSDVAVELRALRDRDSTSTAPRRLHFVFGRRPIEIAGTGGRVERLRLAGSGPADDGSGSAVDELAVQTVVSSIGFIGERLADLPWNKDRGAYDHEAGRVEAGLYAVGWAKRGSAGVLGTVKACAAETAATVIGDLADRVRSDALGDIETLRGELDRSEPPITDWAGWKRIDAAEVAFGQKRGRGRVKITDSSLLRTIGKTSGQPWAS
jgi:ferredoxin--NADP+ reductase